MYFICTGKPPFEPDSAIEVNDSFLFIHKLQSYQDSPTFADMVDFLRQLMEVDAENRLSSEEALRHPWLNAAPYQDNNTLRRLQKKVMTEEELAEVGQIETSNINADRSANVPKSPLHKPITTQTQSQAGQK